MSTELTIPMALAVARFGATWKQVNLTATLIGPRGLELR
jgi:hypothetical protein